MDSSDKRVRKMFLEPKFRGPGGRERFLAAVGVVSWSACPGFNGTPPDQLTVICGPMFAGKTTRLISYVGTGGVVFKPALDTRDEHTVVKTHDGVTVKATTIPHDEPERIFDLVSGHDTIGIDEVQFFSPAVVSVCEELVRMGKKVYVAGLDMDYTGKPFGCVPKLLAVSTRVEKVTSICSSCGDYATRTQRVDDQEGLVVIGGSDVYQARCLSCWVVA